MRVEVPVLGCPSYEPSGFRGRKAEPCFGIGLSLSLICQLTSEDIKQHYLPAYLPTYPSYLALRPASDPLQCRVMVDASLVLTRLCLPADLALLGCTPND